MLELALYFILKDLTYLGLNCRGTQLSTPKFNLFWDSICFGTQFALGLNCRFLHLGLNRPFPI